jgi:hypothetical protein
MDKPLADKWIRKAVYTAINNIVVDGVTVPCFDTRVTNNSIDHFVLMSTQTSSVAKANKCEFRWECSILIDVVTSYDGSGNTGSRLLADNIMDSVRNLTNNLTLDITSGLKITNQTQNFPNDITTITNNQNIFRKLMRIELTIN